MNFLRYYYYLKRGNYYETGIRENVDLRVAYVRKI